MGRHRDEPVELEVTEENSQTLAKDLREWPGQMPERSKLIEVNQLSKISLIVSPGSEIHRHGRMVPAAGAPGKVVDQAPGERSTTIVTNRPGDAAQPAPAGIAKRNQPVIQHPAITEPTGLWCEQRVEIQPEGIEDSHLFLLRRRPAKVRSCWIGIAWTCYKNETTEPRARGRGYYSALADARVLKAAR